MNCKFVITCKRCGCKMEFTTEHTESLHEIKCQNCGQNVEHCDFLHLNTALSSLKRLPEETSLDDGLIPNDEGFKITLASANEK